jgi:tRNA threonylcarbamoyladenosine biosynthesis protein TsaB
LNILALDSSDRVLSLALGVDAEVWYTEIDAGSRHSELIMESIEYLFKISGLPPGDLGFLACMKGPGSFTGLRIAYSTAKGISLSLGIPIKSVPTLDCMARSFSGWPGLVIPLIDAKKGCFFAALYRNSERLSDYFDAQPEIIIKEMEKLKNFPEEPVILTGSGTECIKLDEFIKSGSVSVDAQSRRGRARELLEIVKSDILLKQDENNSGPFYIRKSDAELKRI